MSNVFQAVQITERVYWVGAIDWALRDFHGYQTLRGTTYNAYLVTAEKVALIDTVRAPFRGELMGRIASVIDPKQIDVIVSNHSEMDHSGCLPEVIDIVEPIRVVASQKGVENLARHLPQLAGRVEAVSDGGTLSLGDTELTFVETKMLHWPDSMMTYLPADKLLFSQDGFGLHLGSTERFADELDRGLIEYELAKYYANIFLPFSPRAAKALAVVGELDIEIVAPDHGPIFRKDLDRLMALYHRWVKQAPTMKAVVIYDTMWGSTAKMARAITEGLAAGGVSVKLLPLRETHRSDVVTEVLEAGALLVGSPTMNATLFPTVADVLTYLNGLSPKNLIGAAFGSYGWGARAVGLINEFLDKMKVDRVDDGLETQYVPDADALAKCYELGKRVAERLAAASVSSDRAATATTSTSPMSASVGP